MEDRRKSWKTGVTGVIVRMRYLGKKAWKLGCGMARVLADV